MNSAETVLAELHALADDAERTKIAKRLDPGVPVIGVRMGALFDVAKRRTDLPLAEVDTLLLRDEYEARMAGVSILDFKARAKGLTGEDRRELYDAWMRRIDRLMTWDLIDRSAPRVLGLHLLHEPRDVLFELAADEDPMRRRTAVVATFAIVRHGDTGDALRLCALLAADPEKLVQTVIGTALREVGRVDPEGARAFLGAHGPTLSAPARRVALTGLA